MIEIFGNKKNQEFLKKNLEDGIFPHAYLFRGAKHLGKKTLAKQFAKSILCSEDLERHPDSIILEGGQDEMIKKVREIRKKICLSPQQASRKVVVCYNIDRMRLDALNTLLKSLEEPLADVIFILTASREVLPTVESRCVVLKFYPLSNHLMKDVAKQIGVPDDTIDSVLSFSMGRPGLVHGFKNKLIDKKLSFLLNADVGELLDFATEISPKKKASAFASAEATADKSAEATADKTADKTKKAKDKKAENVDIVANIQFLLYNWIGEARELMLSESFSEKAKAINLLKELLQAYESISMSGANVKLILENLFLYSFAK